MNCSQDLLELDSEVSRTNLHKDSDPYLPVLLSPKVPEELLKDGIDTPPNTPLHSPIHFLKKGGYFHHHLLNLQLPPSLKLMERIITPISQ